MFPEDGQIDWAPKVPQGQIRRLYETDAHGILDDEQIEKVGWALWDRCDSIMTVTATHYGHVRCPACRNVIERQQAGVPNEIITCATCGWSIAWQIYHRTYPLAQTARAKMLLIDQLIHAFHVGLQDTGRPVAANLIQGSLMEVISFLETLTTAETSATGIGASRDQWRRTLASAAWFTPANRSEDAA